ncbi:hypothetical protein EMCRGX_G031710 [Ephydatia muelleri]|eukprot:Em0018g272a
MGHFSIWLKKASRLTVFHQNSPKSPEKIEQSPVSLSTDLSPENNVDCLPVVDDCASSPEKNEQSPVSLSTDLSPENDLDCLPVVDDCASSPEKNEQSPVSLSTDIDAHFHMPLQDDADCSPILIGDCVSSAENVCKFWMSGFQLYKSDENDLLVGNELSDAVINAAQHLLKQSFTTINGFQSPTLGQVLQFKSTPLNAVQILHKGSVTGFAVQA